MGVQWQVSTPRLDDAQVAARSTTARLGNNPAVAALLALPATTAWTGPTFQNGWSNFLGGNLSAAYHKIGNRVELRGLVTGGTVGGGTPIFTLPTGFRPTAQANYGITTTNYVIVASDGRVCAIAPTTNASVSLDGIFFDVV